MTFADYKSIIINYLPASKARPDSEFLTAINFARKEIARIFDPLIIYATFNTVPEKQEYSLTETLGYSYFENIDKLLNVQCSFGTYIYNLVKSFKEHFYFTSFVGLPVYYYHFGDTLGFFPIPAQEYQIQIKLSKIPADLTKTSVELDELLPYRELIVLHSCEHIAMYLGNAELAGFFRSIYEQKKASYRTQYR